MSTSRKQSAVSATLLHPGPAFPGIAVTRSSSQHTIPEASSQQADQQLTLALKTLLLSHSASHLAHAVASLLLCLAWNSIKNDCPSVATFITNLHAVLTVFYALIASGKLLVLLNHYLGKETGAKIMAVLASVLSAKVYVLGLVGEGVLEVATFASICTQTSSMTTHLWLSRAFFAVSMVISSIFLIVSLLLHPSHSAARQKH